MKDIKEILEKVYKNKDLRKSVVPLFIGNPGMGKTVLIEEFAKDKGVELVELITSQMSPFEISGIAMPDKDTKKMTYFNFDKLENLKDGDILFFDELLNGNPVVLNACLTMLEQRRFISGKPLPDIMIIAAANPQGMTPLTPQIKERFVWYDVKYDRKMWIDYMIEKYAITKTIGTKLSNLIENETFSSNNFNTPRSIDKAVNMIINDVPTPYKSELLMILSETIENKLTEPIKLSKDRSLEVGEMITWLDLIKLKQNIHVDKKDIKKEVKSEFKLPEKWYIKINTSNFDEIYEGYFIKKSCSWNKHIGLGLSDTASSWGIWRSKEDELKVKKEYTKITLSQFRKHVLKK